MVAQALRLQPLPVGRDDRDDRHRLSARAMSLSPDTMRVTFSSSVFGSGMTGTFWR